MDFDFRHAVTDNDTGQPFVGLAVGFTGNLFDAIDSNGALVDVSNAEIVISHPTRDIVLIRLDGLALDSSGGLIEPMQFFGSQPAINTILLFGGYGDNGDPSEATPGGSTGNFDGFARAARGNYFRKGRFGLELNVWFMEYEPSVSLAGIYNGGDSGGFTAVEDNGQLFMVGINDQVSGSGLGARSGFESFFFDADFFTWLNSNIDANPPAADTAADHWGLYE